MKTNQQELELLAEWLGYAAKAVLYDPETGHITWRPKHGSKDVERWNARYAGKECGTINDNGYRRILFRKDGQVFRTSAHRLAWFIFYGKLPDGMIDHINKDRLDNRAANLRDVSNSENMRNMKLPSNNTSGYIGVTWAKKRNKWAAQVRVNNRHHHLGYFDDAAEANQVATEFRKRNGFADIHGCHNNDKLAAMKHAAYRVCLMAAGEGKNNGAS